MSRLCPLLILRFLLVLLLLLLLTMFVTQSPELWNPVLLALFPTTALASIAVNAATLKGCLDNSSSSSSSSSSALLSLLEVSPPKTGPGWVYSVFVLLYLATGTCWGMWWARGK